MSDIPLHRSQHDDPRKLREMLLKVTNLAGDHRLTSVVVGMAAPEGDRIFPEVVDFVESALRVDDSIVRMTRDRSVLFLTDVDRVQAESIMRRILSGFGQHFPAIETPSVELGYFEITPGGARPSVKDVLPALFADSRSVH